MQITHWPSDMKFKSMRAFGDKIVKESKHQKKIIDKIKLFVYFVVKRKKKSYVDSLKRKKLSHFNWVHINGLICSGLEKKTFNNCLCSTEGSHYVNIYLILFVIGANVLFRIYAESIFHSFNSLFFCSLLIKCINSVWPHNFNTQ